MSRILAALRVARLSILVLAVGLLLPVVAFAQETLNPDDLGAVLSAFLKALTLTGPAKWFGLLFAGVVLAVWAVRRLVPAETTVGRFIRTDEGGTLLGWLVSAAGALLSKLLVGESMTWAMAGAAFLAAAGGTGALWSQVRRLLRLVVPLVAKIPPPVGPLLAQVLTWIAGEPAAVQVQKAAEKLYKAGPAPTAAGAAAELGKPPAP